MARTLELAIARTWASVAASAVPGVVCGAEPAGGTRAALTGDLAQHASSAPGLPTGYTSEYLIGVALVLLALGALAFVARRMQGHGAFGRGALRIESSLPLGGRERLMIVDVEGQRLLLGVGAGGVRTLTQLPARDDAPVAEHPPHGWLARTLRRDAP